MQVVDDGQRPFGHNLPSRRAGTTAPNPCRLILGIAVSTRQRRYLRAYVRSGPHACDSRSAQGELVRFDQDALRPGGVDALLASSGYLYVPSDCAAGKACGVMVAFHGCKQNVDAVGEAFVKRCRL
jgi:hypothetical protein